MAKGDTVITRLDPVHAAYGGAKRGVFKAVLDNYKTGGYTFALTAFNMGTLKNVQVPAFLLGYALEYDFANAKLKVYTSPGVAGVTAGALSLTTAVTPSVSATVSDRYVLSFTKDVAISQSDVEVFQYTAPDAASIVSVNVYCSAKASTAGTVDVKVDPLGGGSPASILTAPVNPTAAADVAATLSGTPVLAGTDKLTVHVTTDGSSTFTDLTVEIVLQRTVAASVTATATGTTTGNAVTAVPAVTAGPMAELTDNSAVLNGQSVYFEAIGLGV